MIQQWLDEYCVRHPRISGGVVVLLRHFNRWLLGQRHRTYSLSEFKKFLEDNDLEVIEVSNTLLVVGLGLREDVENQTHWRGKFVSGRS